MAVIKGIIKSQAPLPFLIDRRKPMQCGRDYASLRLRCHVEANSPWPKRSTMHAAGRGEGSLHSLSHFHKKHLQFHIFQGNISYMIYQWLLDMATHYTGHFKVKLLVYILEVILVFKVTVRQKH